MTYEEALARVLQVAGDYTNISNTHDIKSTLYKQELAQLKGEIDSTVKGLSLSPESIQLYVEGGGLVVEAFGERSRAWRTVYEAQLLKCAATEFPDYIERALRGFIRDHVLSASLAVKDVQRFCGYAALITNSITAEMTSNLTRVGDRIVEVNKEANEEITKYRKYCADLKMAMKQAATCWLSQLIITPGMKLSIEDLRSTTKLPEVRKVKRVSYSNGEVVIAFENTASIVRGTSRINVFESWIINNAKYLEMAKVLKDGELERLY